MSAAEWWFPHRAGRLPASRSPVGRSEQYAHRPPTSNRLAAIAWDGSDVSGAHVPGHTRLTLRFVAERPCRKGHSTRSLRQKIFVADAPPERSTGLDGALGFAGGGHPRRPPHVRMRVRASYSRVRTSVR
ncbi:hypothetical protein GCM10009527_062640 [Actinomadura nitritigenes]